jgi:hypothetical protein
LNFFLPDRKYVTVSRFSISELVLPVYKENGVHENSATAWIMSSFSMTCVNGSDIMKISACSEVHQQAGDFVMHWYVGEMSISIK